MHPSTPPFADPPQRDDEAHDERALFWRRLLYRWFVEYNPLYLLSAALVLAGCFLLSGGLAAREPLVASTGIALVAEIYAAGLLGGMALLTRIGPKRPAVMLALIFVIYQWDLTLHTETCSYLGAAGGWAVAAWIAIFAAKLYALGWAMRIRLAPHAVAAASLAAIGLALGPRVISDLGPRNAGALLAAWIFALGALYRGADGVTSLVELTAWGRTVLRRVTRAAWILSGALLGVHVWFWARDHEIAVSMAIAVAPLLHVRRVRSEGRAWALVAGTLALVALAHPSAFFVTALLAAAALCARALSPQFPADTAPPSPARAPDQPYRAGSAPASASEPATPISSAPSVGPTERARAFTGAIFALYLSTWTVNWTGGPWPAHVLPLDLALTAALLATAWRARARSALAPLAGCYAHVVVQTHILPAPRSHAEWGALAIAVGFALLGGSLAVSYRLRAPAPRPPLRNPERNVYLRF